MAVEPLRLDRPTLDGEEPERDRGGVCTDIMAAWKDTGVIELERKEIRCQLQTRAILNIVLAQIKQISCRDMITLNYYLFSANSLHAIHQTI